MLALSRLGTLPSSIIRHRPEAASTHSRTVSASSSCSNIRVRWRARVRNHRAQQSAASATAGLGRAMAERKRALACWRSDGARSEISGWDPADLPLAPPYWAQETLHRLHRYDGKQMLSHIQNLGPSEPALPDRGSFQGSYVENRRGLRRVLTVSQNRGPPRRHSRDPEATGAGIDWALLCSAVCLVGCSLGRERGNVVEPLLPAKTPRKA